MQDTYLLGCLELPIIAYNHMSLCFAIQTPRVLSVAAF